MILATGGDVQTDSAYLDIVTFLLGLGFGFVGFSQIAYPLVTLIPKVRVLLQADRQRRYLLLALLVLSPAVWVLLLASTVLLVHRHLPAQDTAYLFGLAVVLLLVLFHLLKRNQEMEREFLNRVKTYARLGKERDPAERSPTEKNTREE